MFSTVAGPDGLSVGTNNIRFFSIPNFTYETAKEAADNILKSGAQVLALQEIEGNASMDSLLMPFLPGWKYKMNDTPGHQDLAFLWNPEAVDMNGEPLVYYADEELPGKPGEKLFSRAPLVAEFVHKASGKPFKISNLHLKSKFIPQGLSPEEQKIAKAAGQEQWKRQVQLVDELLGELSKNGMAVFGVGDWNRNIHDDFKYSQDLKAAERPRNFGITTLSNPRGTPKKERKYSYDSYGGKNLDAFAFAGVPRSALSPVQEIETNPNKVPGGQDHDLLSLEVALSGLPGVSPTDYAEAILSPNASKANTEGWDPAFVNNPYALDALRGEKSALQNFRVNLPYSEPPFNLKKGDYPWHNRIEYEKYIRAKEGPQPRHLLYSPVSWLTTLLSNGPKEKPALPEEYKNGTSNAFTGFSWSDVIPFISKATSNPAKSLMKSFRYPDEMQKSIGQALLKSGLGDWFYWRKWNGYPRAEKPKKGQEEPDAQPLKTDITFTQKAPQPMNVEDADDLAAYFATPADIAPPVMPVKTPEQIEAETKAGDPERSGYDEPVLEENSEAGAYLKTPDVDMSRPEFRALLPLIGDAAYSLAAGFNGAAGGTLNGLGVLAHSVTDPIAKATGWWDPANTNVLQDMGRWLYDQQRTADRRVSDEDSLLNGAMRHTGAILPYMASIAAGGAPAAAGGLINPTAASALGRMIGSTLSGSMAQTAALTGDVYKTAREIGATHDEAMNAAGKAALAGAVFNTGANLLAGPHGLFTAGRLSDNPLLRKIFGASYWVERSALSPVRMAAKAMGLRWPRAYIELLKSSRVLHNAGLRAYSNALANAEFTRAALQSSMDSREINGDKASTFLGRLFNPKDFYLNKQKILANVPAYFAGAFTAGLTHFPQIARNVKGGWSQDKRFYARQKAEKQQLLRQLVKDEVRLSDELASASQDKSDELSALLRDNRLMQRDVKSSSALGKTLFPYKSPVAQAYDNWMFTPYVSRADQRHALQAKLDDVNSKLAIRQMTPEEIASYLSPKRSGHFVKSSAISEPHFVPDNTALDLDDLLRQRSRIVGQIDDLSHPLRDALRSVGYFAKDQAHAQIEKFLDYWDLQPKLVLSDRDQRVIKNGLFAQIREDLERMRSYSTARSFNLDKAIDRILDEHKNLPKEFRRQVKSEYLDRLRTVEDMNALHRAQTIKDNAESAREELRDLMRTPLNENPDEKLEDIQPQELSC